MFDNILCTQRLAIDHMVQERALVTCTEMLSDRGYTDVRPILPGNLTTTMRDEEPVIVARHPEYAHEFLVFFLMELKIGIKTIRRLVPLIGQRAHGMLLVSVNGATPFTKKELLQTNEIEIVIFKRVVFNYARSTMVPRHRLLSAAEEAQVRTRFKTRSEDEWPKLLSTDAIFVYYAFPLGRLIEIERYVGAEPSTYYRITIAAT